MYLVIGGNGFLGNYVIKSILDKTDEKIIATVRNLKELKNTSRLTWKQCSIENDADFDHLINEIKEIKGIKVIFLAAYHHPDMVAEHPQAAWNINVTILSKCVNKLYFVKRLFYASTDSVYGNSIENHHFVETDLLHPVNFYGHNKAAAEAIVTNYGFNVVRFPFLIAPSLVQGKDHFYDKIKRDLMNGKKIEMFSDSYRSSLNFSTAADILIDLCELPDKVPCILNVCGDKDLSKYDIGLILAKKLKVDSHLVKPLLLADGEDIFKTARATSTLMDNSKVKQILHMNTIEFVL